MIETMIGNSIANQCSPVLMDVKPSNLLILTREEEERFLEMEDIPGIWGICLHRGEQKSIWLLYRKDRLEALLLSGRPGKKCLHCRKCCHAEPGTWKMD